MNQAANDSELFASEPSRLQGRRVLIGLLVAAVVLIHLLAMAAHYVTGNGGPPEPTGLLLFGFTFADASLAALYLVLGRSSATSRFFVALAMALGGGVTGGYARALHEPGEDLDHVRLWCGIALFHALLTAVPVVYLLARGLRVVHPEDPPTVATTRKPSFTLWGMMSFTTCAAVLLAIGRLATFPTPDFREVLSVSGIGACVAYIAAAAMLSDRPLQSSVAWVGGAAIVAAIAIPRFVHALDGWESSMFMLSQASLLVGVMFVLRMAGYRLRWPEYVVPGESPFPTTAVSKRDAAAESTAPNQP